MRLDVQVVAGDVGPDRVRVERAAEADELAASSPEAAVRAAFASPSARVAELLFGAVAMNSVAWASVSSASGRPMKSHA